MTQQVVTALSDDLRLSDFVMGELVQWLEKDQVHFGVVIQITSDKHQTLSVQAGNPYPTRYFLFDTPEQLARNREEHLRKTTLVELLEHTKNSSRDHAALVKQYQEVMAALDVLRHAR